MVLKIIASIDSYSQNSGPLHSSCVVELFAIILRSNWFMIQMDSGMSHNIPSKFIVI